MNNSFYFDLSKLKPIEIDVDKWKTLSPKERLIYLKNCIFNEIVFSENIDFFNFVVKSISKIVKSTTKNKTIIEYMNFFEESINIFNTSIIISNLIKPKSKNISSVDNEIAKLMGFNNSNNISYNTINVIQSVIKNFVNLSDEDRIKYGINITKVVNWDVFEKKINSGSNISDLNIYVVGEYVSKNIKFGLVFTDFSSVNNVDKSISQCTCNIYVRNDIDNVVFSNFVEEMFVLFYKLYLNKIDVSKNIVRIVNNEYEIIPRIDIKENIVNVDIDKIVNACKKTFIQKNKRGVIFVGEPGTGKTIAVHKIINNFKDKLIFWVMPDTINTLKGIRSLNRLLKMFDDIILVFDDLDAYDFLEKNEVTNEFLSFLDGTNKISCFILATINDPSKLHVSIINRPERFDDIIEVKKPQTIEEISNIFIYKCNEFGYYFENEKIPKMTSINGTIKFNKKSKKYLNLCKKILEYGFTQVMVSSLARDCYIYSKNNCITIDDFNNAINSRVESIRCANLKCVKGKLKNDEFGILTYNNIKNKG